MKSRDLFKKEHSDEQSYVVIHPLDDQPEQKKDLSNFEPMKMTFTVRLSLIILRVYLISMILLLAYHFLNLTGIIKL
jgi:uncharacterized membrane protein (DUF485 family)